MLSAAKKYLDSIPPPPTGENGRGPDPAANAAWWKRLTPQQRADCLVVHPAAIGAMNGVPTDRIRDEANRVVLDGTRAQARCYKAPKGASIYENRDTGALVHGPCDLVVAPATRDRSGHRQFRVGRVGSVGWGSGAGSAPATSVTLVGFGGWPRRLGRAVPPSR